MNTQNLFNQFIGSVNTKFPSVNSTQSIGNTLSKLGDKIPGGLAGGAAVGDIMALLIGNKSIRKIRRQSCDVRRRCITWRPYV